MSDLGNAIVEFAVREAMIGLMVALLLVAAVGVSGYWLGKHQANIECLERIER